MFELLTDPSVWASFLTLSLLEIVLGVDNVIFIVNHYVTITCSSTAKGSPDWFNSGPNRESCSFVRVELDY